MLTNSDGEFNSLLFFFLVSSKVMAGESFCLIMAFCFPDLPRVEQAHVDLAVLMHS